MFKTITLKDAKGKDIDEEFLANAATPLRYKSIFKADLLTSFANARSENPDGTVSYNIDFLPELSFIMAMQAKAADNKDVKLEKLSNNEFMDWLEGLDSFTIEENSEEILSVYYGNADTTSEAKKNSDKQSEK